MHIGSVIAIESDQNGGLWAIVYAYGSQNYLAKLNGSNWNNIYPRISNVQISGLWNLEIDQLGNVWVGTSDNGLLKYNGSVWSVFNRANAGLPDSLVKCVISDTEDKIWFGTKTGFGRLDGSVFTNYTIQNSVLPQGVINSFAAGNNSAIWFGSNGYLGRLLNNNISHYQSGYIVSIASSVSGDIWLAQLFNISKFDGTNFTVYDTSNSTIKRDLFVKAAVDSQENKWFGAFGGVYKFDGTTWINYDTSNSGLPYNTTWEIAFDKAGNKWIGTSNRLARFDDTVWTVFDSLNSGLKNHYILAICIDKQNVKWIGTGNGLFRYNDTVWTWYTTSNSGLTSNGIKYLATDKDDYVWVAAGKNLVKFDGQNWSRYTPYNSKLYFDDINAFYIDKNNNKWIGYTYSGITAFREGGVILDVDAELPTTSKSATYLLEQNYPNPFNPSTTIRYHLPAAAKVTLKVYDVLGKEVTTLVNENKDAGKHEAAFNGAGLSSGLYLYRLQSRGMVHTGKMILLK
ncbi:MAG: T9SS type A sorting domain-containing protein [Ignavibacteriales bacterium]|nr:T9SS type A sorting domain-containing protein [Ignavibacteriales bacterium]